MIRKRASGKSRVYSRKIGAFLSDMIEGIGRAAVHEFAHQILGAVAMDNATDKNSYEYASFDRAAQYYGELLWSSAWPGLQRKIGR